MQVFFRISLEIPETICIIGSAKGQESVKNGEISCVSRRG